MTHNDDTVAGDEFTAPAQLHLQALAGVPLVRAGDDIGTLIATALAAAQVQLLADDVIVIAQKIVSKSEGRSVELSSVVPSPRASELAARTGKDPRLVELILRESREVRRVGKEVLIVEHRSGFVLANAGIDQSNVNADALDATALLLPVDADASAARIRTRLLDLCKVAPGVLIIDSIGRAWRRGTVGQAIGAAGVPVWINLRGRKDIYGRVLRASDLAVADELAAAASLLMGQSSERRPLVHVRGLRLAHAAGDGGGATLLQRPNNEDLFP